jgi:hypothetical protein
MILGASLKFGSRTVLVFCLCFKKWQSIFLFLEEIIFELLKFFRFSTPLNQLQIGIDRETQHLLLLMNEYLKLKNTHFTHSMKLQSFLYMRCTKKDEKQSKIKTRQDSEFIKNARRWSLKMISTFSETLKTLKTQIFTFSTLSSRNNQIFFPAIRETHIPNKKNRIVERTAIFEWIVLNTPEEANPTKCSFLVHIESK